MGEQVKVCFSLVDELFFEMQKQQALKEQVRNVIGYLYDLG